MLLLSTYQTLPNLAFCLSSNKRIKKQTHKTLDKIFSTVSTVHTKNSGGDSNVSAQASMKLSTNPSTNYECEISSKHKVYLKQFKSQIWLSMNHT